MSEKIIETTSESDDIARGTSLRTKLVTMFGASLVLVLGITAALVITQTVKMSEEEIDTSARTLATTISDAVQAFGQTGDMEGLEQFLANIKERPGLGQVHAVRSALTEQDFGPREGASPQDEVENEVLNTKTSIKIPNPQAHSIRYVMPLLNDQMCMGCHSGEEGEALGLVSVTISTEASNKAAASLRNMMIGVFIVAVLAEMIFLFLTITGSIIRPLDLIVGRLRDIAHGEGDLTQRLQVSTRDEVGQLAHWFNTFINKLQGIIADVARNADTLASSAMSLTNTSSDMTSQTQSMTEQSTTASEATEEASTNLKSMAAGIESRSA